MRNYTTFHWNQTITVHIIVGGWWYIFSETQLYTVSQKKYTTNQ